MAEAETPDGQQGQLTPIFQSGGSPMFQIPFFVNFASIKLKNLMFRCENALMHGTNIICIEEDVQSSATSNSTLLTFNKYVQAVKQSNMECSARAFQLLIFKFKTGQCLKFYWARSGLKSSLEILTG